MTSRFEPNLRPKHDKKVSGALAPPTKIHQLSMVPQARGTMGGGGHGGGVQWTCLQACWRDFLCQSTHYVGEDGACSNTGARSHPAGNSELRVTW